MKLGDIVVFKTHPYSYKLNPLKISANSLFTPPLMVIDQIAYLDDTKSTIVKLRCRFYNSNSNRIEENWFEYGEIELFEETSSDILEFVKYGKYTLKSCIHELKKLKTNYQIENTQIKSSATSLLNHLPPNFIALEKVSLITKGNLCLKDFGSIGFKVKWFCPESGKYKIDILPQEILMQVENSHDLSFLEEVIKRKWIFRYPLKSEIKVNDLGKLEESLFRVVDVRYNHISVIIKIYDIILNQEQEIPLNDFLSVFTQVKRLYSDYFIDKYPKLMGNKFESPQKIKLQYGIVYSIKYSNAFQEVSNRCIVVLKILTIEEGDEKGFLIEAYCLLRCEVRYFWTHRILELSISNILLK